MFYTYNQNNSGGKFTVNEYVGQYVIVEAENEIEANKIAEDKANIYFNGCDDRIDCDCCGDRWYPQYKDGTKVPMIYDKTIEEFKQDPKYTVSKEICIHIYFKDGRHDKIVFDAKKAIEEKKKKKREIANKLWGNYFVLSRGRGLTKTEPIQFYKYKSLNIFYDETENLSIKKGVTVNKEYGWISFASEDKKEVKDFMEGISELMEKVTLMTLDITKAVGKKGEGMVALAKLLKIMKV